jgi:serine acetyltransferase
MTALLLDPGRLWLLSTRLWQQGKRRRARLVKAYVFVTFRAALPPEAILRGPVGLGHWAMNVVVHPNTTIGRNVMIWHGVTLSVSDTPGTDARLEIGDNVTIGTGAVIVTPLRGGLTICDHVAIGANSVVSRSITEPGTYVGAPATRVDKRTGQY